jgi:hypothetical protein
VSSSLQQAIFDWVQTLPVWQQDLARRLAIDDTLGAQEREEVLRLVLDESPTSMPVPLQMEDLPSEEGSTAPVQLRALGDMQNINCLAPDQLLRFEAGLNVVYGDTGAGKSGHTRLLRRSCRSVKPGEVLRDVFNPGAASGRQTAKILTRVGEEDGELELDLEERPPQVLSSVSVFDAACAQVYVSEDNQIDFVPRPLVLFDRMVRAQGEMSALLSERSDALAQPSMQLEGFSPETEVGQLVADLSAAGAGERARTLAALTAPEHAELERLTAIEAELRSPGGVELEAAASRMASALEAACSALDDGLKTVADDVLHEAQTIRESREQTIAAQRELARDALADAPVPGTGERSWKLLWEAARGFATSNGVRFPDVSDGARCGLCQQELDEHARRRFVDFEQFVSNDLEEGLRGLRERASSLLQSAPDPRTLWAQVDASLAGIEDEDIATATATALSAYTHRRAALCAWLAEDEPDVGLDDPPAPPPRMAAFTDAIAAQRKSAAFHAELRDECRQRELIARLAELRDRTLLAERLPAVLERVEQLCRRERIANARRDMDSQRISMTQRKLGMQVITSDLREALAQELSRLTPQPPPVTVAGSVRKGQIVVRVKLAADRAGHGVAQVLSDGEQRALSMAFFLAELAVGTNRSAIVLDDPITSLDQTRREYVARRLVRESRERQVIVFTHDLAFLMLLQAEAHYEQVGCHGQTLVRAAGKVGIARDGMPFEGLSPQRRLRELRDRLAQLGKRHREEEPAYAEEAESWCVQLRQAWEQTIEVIVLNGVVARFRPTIEPKRLGNVRIDDEVKERVERAMERTSPWAHYRSPALGLPAPTPETMEVMASELVELHDLLDPNKPRLRSVPEVNEQPDVA